MKRRTFLKGTLASGVVGTAVTAGLLTPQMVLAAWPTASFKAKSVDDAISALHGSSASKKSNDITIKAPDIAENGAVVPITISTKMSNVETISVLVEKNPLPLVCHFTLSSNAIGFASTRIKMGKTSPITAVIKSGGKLYSNSKTVKVTIGGCGG